MQKVRVAQNSFQYGEASDSLLMRTDSPVYAGSAQSLENMVVMAEGSVKKRFGMKHIYNYSITYSSSYPEQSHLMPFVFDSNEEYVISVEHQKVRCFRLLTDGTVSLVATITQDTNSNTLPFDQEYLQEYTHAQSGDVMWICHPLFAPRLLIRTSLTDFEIQTYTFDQRADNKVTFQPYTSFHGTGVTLDPSATTGNGVTLTVSEAYWDTGTTKTAGINAGSFVTDEWYIITTVGTTDFTLIGANASTVGQVFKATGAGSGTGVATNVTEPAQIGSIVRYGRAEIEVKNVRSSTVAVGDITDELKVRLTVLNPLRTIDGSTTVEVTHINHGFGGGEAITVEEASATGGINAGNLNGSRTVGTIIDENTYTITAGGSASSAEDGGGRVKIVCHAPTSDWDEQAYSGYRGYPAAVTFHENRLCFGGTLAEPDAIWMSKVGEYFNHDVGEAADNDAIVLVAATGDVNEIRYMISNRDLQVFTNAGELYVPTYLNQATTPTNAQIRKQTPYGTSFVTPMSIDGATIFVQQNGKIVREYIYTDSEDAYTSVPVSTISSHLFLSAPKYLAVAHSGFELPDSYAAMTLSNGDIAAFSSNRVEKRASWTKFSTNGSFSSVVAIEDRLFVNAYDSENKLQLCEFSGDIGLDFYIYQSVASNLADVSSLYSNGDVVDVLGFDGTNIDSLGQKTVNSSNQVDITGHSGYTHVYVGKKFTAKIITNPVDAAMGSGPSTGETRGVTNIVVDFKNTRSAKVNTRPLIVESSFTGKREFRALGYSRDPQVTIEQNDPLPMQVNGIVAELIV